MPTIHLHDRALLSVTGPEAEHFLQNVLTNDFGALEAGEVRPGALLNPQGKILFDYLVSRNGPDDFLIECREDIAHDFMKRLTLYRLRAKAEIAKRDQAVVAVSWDADSADSKDGSAGPADRRFPDEARVYRFYEHFPAQDASAEDWKLMRIRHGVAESGTDYELGDAFPHDVLLDQNGGVGLKKGCYVGQEVVSHMQHRGTARRRVLIAHGKCPLPVSSR
ncbi:MAG TPA: folate-binding protein, partial [Rhizobiaceae bacterium]|nr:folate-binding protein [Rhizobiaceae bacterium]